MCIIDIFFYLNSKMSVPLWIGSRACKDVWERLWRVHLNGAERLDHVCISVARHHRANVEIQHGHAAGWNEGVVVAFWGSIATGPVSLLFRMSVLLPFHRPRLYRDQTVHV